MRTAVSAALASVMLAGSLAAAAAVSAAPAEDKVPARKPAAAGKPATEGKPATAARKATDAGKPATAGKAATPTLPTPLAAAAPGAKRVPTSPSTVDGNRAVVRAKKWADAKVPYSQTGYKDGYRRDCSGFVSMAWDLPDNMITSNLPEVSKPVRKEDLRPGDILLNASGGRGRHAVIFEKWTDASKTKYVALEEAGATDRAVRRVVPYPYEYDKSFYKPYRYSGMGAWEREVPKNQRQLVDGWLERKTAEVEATRAAVASSTAAARKPAPAVKPVRADVAAVVDPGLLGRMLDWLGL